MDTTSNGNIAAQVCASLHTQLGALFECLPAGERVQIRTPFTYPDGDLIDLYWRDTPQGQVVSDLGDTCGWLFVNGAHDNLTAKQNQAYDDACSTYGVERRDGLLLTYVVDGKLADAVVRLVQAITVVSQTVDVGQQSAPAFTRGYFDSPRLANRIAASGYPSSQEMTATKIAAAIEQQNWQYSRKVKWRGQWDTEWTIDFVVQAPERNAVLIALYERRSAGWQKRAIAQAFAVFSDLVPVLKQQTLPHKPISVIDDTDVEWAKKPVEMLKGVSEVVHLSEPGRLPAAILE